MENKDLYFRLFNQHIIDVILKFDIYDLDGTFLEEVSGVITGGSINVDSGSAVRRTASLSISPIGNSYDIIDTLADYLRKNIKIKLGIRDQKTREITYINQGTFLFESISTSYDVSNNIINIELSDWALRLDGTVNGKVGGMITTILKAYEEDAQGNPISFTTIKKALEDILHSAGIAPEDYTVCDIGEYYAFPEHNPDWQEYRERYPLWNMIPYDLEFSAGASVWDMISEVIQLYPNYDAAYDENGHFVVTMIPSEESEAYDFEYVDYKNMIISEQVQTNLTNVYNVCEVWGECLDTDWYSSNVTNEGGCYNITLEGYNQSTGTYTSVSGDTLNSIAQHYDMTMTVFRNLNKDITDIEWQAMEAFLPEGTQLKVILSKTDKYRTGEKVAITIPSTNVAGQMLKINDLPALPIIDKSTNYPIAANMMDVNHMHVFYVTKIATQSGSGTQDVVKEYVTGFGDTIGKICERFKMSEDGLRSVNSTIPDDRWEIMKTFIGVGTVINIITQEIVDPVYISQVFYLGVEQSHGIDVLTDGTTIPEGYEDPYTHDKFDTYSKAYYQHIWNCDNVSLTVLKDSPFVVQKIGERIDVKQGSEFENITSNALALERAQYENWKNSRLTNNITITTKLMPFISPYMKVEYKNKSYIIQSISHDFDNGTSSITMYTFYPLYKQRPGMDKRMTYKFMSGYSNIELYGNQDEQIS